MPGVRRKSGEAERADFRLRKICGGAQGPRRLVRRFDAERAVSRRGQEDHGLRTVGTVWREIAGCDFVSDGRRRGADWHVPGIRWKPGDGLDWRKAAAH